MSLGAYPKLGLKDARKAGDDAQRLLDQQIDPGMQRRASKLAPCKDGDPESFESVARDGPQGTRKLQPSVSLCCRHATRTARSYSRSARRHPASQGTPLPCRDRTEGSGTAAAGVARI